MSFEFILIAVLAAWVGVDERRLTRLEKEIENLRKDENANDDNK